MRTTSLPLRIHDGFTLLELLVVLVVAGIVLGTAVPAITNGLNQSRVQRAAAVAAADLQLAHSMAGRARQPIRIAVDTASRMISIQNEASPSTVYSQRSYGSAGEHPVQTMAASDTRVVVFPSGMTDGPLAVTFGIGGNRRRVTMNRGGQVRVVQP